MIMSNEEKIWRWLKERTTLPEVAIAGIMGNFEAESNCEPCRVQGDLDEDRAQSRRYAERVDSGELTDYSFAHDGKGWGLYQLTFWSRKAGFLEYCRLRGCSVAELEAQLEYMLTENEYKLIEQRLMRCATVNEAAELFCREFERPAVCNTVARANYGQGFYAQFHGAEAGPENKIQQAMALLQEAVNILKEVS